MKKNYLVIILLSLNSLCSFGQDCTTEKIISDPIICLGDNATITLFASVTGMNYQLQSGVTAIGSPVSGTTGTDITFSVAPFATTTYTVIATDGICSITYADDALVTVNPLPTPTAGSNAPQCSGATLNLTAAGGTSYSWTGPNSFSSTAQNPSINNVTTAASGTYTVTVTDSNGCFASTTTNIVINALPTATAGSNTPLCSGATLNLTASGGTSYSWIGPNGFTSTAQNPSINNVTTAASGTYTVTVTDLNGCINTATVLVTVNPLLVPSVIIGVSPGNNICAGTSVTFTAAPVNGGTTPVYQWKINGINTGTDSPMFTTSLLANTDKVTVVLTSNATCPSPANVTSNIITMTVNDMVTPSISISSSATTICPGNTVNFSAIPINGGSIPSYQWMVNGLNAGTNSPNFSTSSLVNGNVVTVKLTSNAACASPITATSNAITITVNPATPATPGFITGTTPVCPGTTGLAYSIAAVTNATTYTWTVPTGWSITAGAGTDAITVKSGSAGQNGNISVTAGNSCGTSAASTLAVTVSPATPATPGIITGTVAQCPAVAGQTYSIAAVTNATTYTWTVPTGWSITAGTGTNSITVTSGSAGQNGNISVTAENSCGTSAARTLAVTVTPAAPATPGAITGTVTQCPALAGQAYSVTAVPNATTYTWIVPTGWSITAGAGTSAITVTSGSAGQNGNITVTAGNSCGTSSANTLAVTVSPATPATPGAITGITPVCPGIIGLTYSIAAVANATTYTWAVPTGWSITAGTGTNSITVTSGSAGQNGNISVTAENSCGTSAARTLGVTVTPAAPATPGAITGTVTQCPALASQVYSVTAVPNATTYTWTVPTGWSITAGAATNSITVTSGGAGQNGNISVTAGNSCGTSAANTLAVTVSPATPATPGIITGTVTQCPALTGQTYSIAAVTNATTYTWAVPAGWSITAGTGTNSITVTSGSAGQNGNVTVTAGNSCGTSAAATLAVIVSPATPATPGVISGSAEQCISKAGLVYSITAVPNATSYTWTLPSGWSITAGINTNSITVATSGAAVGGNITVSATNSCGTSGVQTFAVTTNTAVPVAPAAPTSPQSTSICPVVAGLQYSVTAVANATNYTWTLPTGWIITAGSGTNAITVTASASAVSGNISVKANNACGSSAASANLVVTVGNFAFVDAGVDHVVCAASPDVSLSPTTGGATGNNNVTWSSSNGGSFSPNANKWNAVYTPGAAAIAAGTVTLTIASDDPSGSCAAVTDQMVITIRPTPTATIAGTTTICSGSSTTITFTATPNTTVTYKIGAGANQTISIDGTGIGTLNTGALAANTTYNLVSVAYPTAPSCSVVISGTATITVNPPATVNANADQTVCASSPNVTLAGSISGAATSATWSGGAGTFNPNNTTLNAIYTPNAGEITAGTVTLTLTTNDPAGPCPTASDQMVITINPSAVANANADQTVCASSAAVTLAGALSGAAASGTWSGGAGTFNPNNTTLGAVYTPTAGEITAGTVTLTLTTNDPAGPCPATSDQMVVTINPSAIANASADQTVCASSPNVILAGSVSGAATSGTWNGGTGTFNPNNTTLNATYTPTAAEITAGTVTLTLTTNDPAGPCPTASDQMVITINPSAVANANADQTVCASSPNVTLAGALSGAAASGTWSGGAGTFNPNTTTLNAVYTPTAAEITAGTVSLTLTTNDPAGPCLATSDQMVITINPSAVANANVDQTVCASSPVVTLAGAISGAATSGTWSGGSGTFNPNNTTLNATYTPTAAEITAGTVTLTLTTNDPAGPCPTAADQMVITINPSAVANANVDQTVCASSPTTTLAGTVSGAATSGSWSGGAGTFSPNNTSLNATYTPTVGEITAGTVTLTLTTNDPAGPCPSISDQMTITISPSATVSAGVPLTICSNTTALMAGSFGGSATSATWSTSGNGTFNNNTPTAIYTPSAADISAGTVTLTYTTNDPIGPCPSINAAILLTIKKAVVITTQPSNTSICASFPADLNVVAIGDGLTYQWYKGTVPTGTPVANSANISGAQLANLHFNQASLTDDGNYYVIVSGASPCAQVTSAQRTLNVDQAIIVSTQPASQTVCSGSNVTFTVVADANGDPLSFQWRKNGTNIGGATSTTTSSTLTINNSTAADAANYDVLISGPAGYTCSSVQSAIAALTVNPLPTISGTLTVCEGATTQLSGSASPAAVTPWVSSNTAVATISTTGLVAGISAGTTLITYTNSNGCKITATVQVNPTPNAIATNTTQTICSASAITTMVLSGNVAATIFNWTRDNTVAVTGIAASGTGNISGSLTNTTSAPVTVTFTVTPTVNGCTGTSITATILVNPTPNAIAAPASQTICSAGAITTIVLSGSVASTTYNWTRDNTAAVTGIAASGAGNISGSLTNTTNAPVTVTFTITPTANGCNGTPISATVLVNPTPNAVATNAAQTICSATAITTMALSGNVAATTYNWTRDNTVAVTGIPASSNGNISGSLTNTTNAPVTVTFTITPTANGCNGTPITATVLVNPMPNAVATNAAQTICSASAITTMALSGNVAATTYNWTRDNTVAVTGIAANGSGNISGSLTNTTNAAVTVTFTITPAANGCNGTPITATVLVNPTPNAVATNAAQTICSATAITTMVLSGNVAATTYNWTRDNTVAVTGIAASGTVNISGSLTNTTNAPVTVTFTITPVANGCSGTPITATVLVNPKPNAVATNAAQTICSASTITTMVLSGNVPATTYNWTRNNTGTVTGIPNSGSGDISGSLTNTTSAPVTVTFTITPIVNGCSGTSITATVLVNPVPNAVATPATQTICSASAITTIVLSGSVAATTFNWTRDNTVAVTGIASSGSANISGSLTNTTNAAVTVTFTITPTANGCTGTPVTATVSIEAASAGGAVTVSQPNIVPVVRIVTVCHSASGTIYLSGYTGTIVRWESSTTGGASWIPIANIGITYDYTNILATTLFRAVIQNALCTLAYSSTAIINVIPNIKPSPVSATPSTICNGDSTVLSSQSGYATSQSLTSGGAFDTANPKDWLVDGCGNCLSAGGSNTNPGPFQESATNGGTYSGINYTSSGKFVIANGNFNSILQTPVFNTLGLTSASLHFDHAYNLLAGASAKVEISIDGGATYNTILAQYNGPGTQLPYTITTNMNIDLSAFLGQTNLKIRFNYQGTVGSSWAIDNIQIPEAPIGVLTSQWVDTRTNTIISNTNATNATVSPTVTTTYAVTSYLNGCTSFGPNGTTYVTVTVNQRPIVTAPPGIICSDDTTNIPLTSSEPGTTFAWTVVQTGVSGASPGTLNTIAQKLTTTGATSGTAVYTITPTSNGCAGTAKTVTIAVNPRPTANIGPSQTICYNGTATFSIALTGTAPWNLTYSNGSTTTTVNNINSNPFILTVPNITVNKTFTVTALSDANCIAKPTDLTGAPTVTVLTGTEGIWTGLVSRDWFDCKNWEQGLPSSTINAVINAGKPNMPLIDPANSPFAAVYSNIASAQDILIAGGASVSMAAIGVSDLQISRDWKNSGVFTPGIGTVTFNGAGANQVQTVNLGIKTNETFYNLTTNNSGTAKGISVVDGFELTVSNAVSLLSGDLRLTGEAQLIQAGTAPNPTAGSGKLLRDQQGQKNSFNYNYWSSPVSANNINYSVGGVLRDGTDVTTSPFSPLAINFGDGAFYADGPLEIPIKISNRWIWSYNSPTPDSNTELQDYFQWNYIGSTGTLKVGEGFTMKGTGGPAAVDALQNYVFVGKPNSGTISLNLSVPDQTYLVGNPYPSAIDANEFILDNLAGRAGVNVFNGALYYWDHFGLSNNHLLAEYQGGYATYTLMGGLKAVADNPLTVNDGSTGSKTPGQYIPVAQAFLVDNALDPTLAGTTATVQGGTLKFKNSQRAFVRETAASSVFMKTAGTKTTTQEKPETRSKIRLGYTPPMGAHRQLLVGVDSHATNEFDIGYEAPMLAMEGDNFYWELSNSKFIIQAIPDFNIDRIIPFGLRIANEGLTTIKIDALENIPETTDIYLYDNATAIYHNIKNTDFKIALAAGEYKTRFSLQFTDRTLGVDENTANGILVLYSNNYKVLIIQNKLLDTTVKEVHLFNLSGQDLSKWDVENREQTRIQIPIKNLSSGVYIVMLKTSKGTYSKKIIIR
ncbi:PKD-like domain-containing protein [Flavobacterium sp. ZS1P14]|uniref:PKD-like domain-containing protein n=1 Tax=Flavobacterium sp. ZS1P14 TaxID=3401729 RepID=UPI003AAF297B